MRLSVKSETVSNNDESLEGDGSDVVEVPIKTLRDYLVAIAQKTAQMIIEDANKAKEDFSHISHLIKKDGIKSSTEIKLT